MTGLLVRSLATEWSKGSILAVDGGTHLAAIIKILEEHLPRAKAEDYSSLSNHARSKGNRPRIPSAADSTKPVLVLTTGPFAGLIVPYDSVQANSAFVLRSLVSTYLITHPHLDHLSGFAINTASFQHTSRPKKVAALPSTIDAIKQHIFNDVIWPNLSDEEGGVGLVSYMRLVEGGNVALGNGEGRGYIEVVEGLAVKSWSVSHGHCMKPHSPRRSGLGKISESTARRTSRASVTPAEYGTRRDSEMQSGTDESSVYDSSAFFIRDDETGREILVFGDVEPDSISLSPRTERVWNDAAPKIFAGSLKGIFIECSYDDSQPDEILFGHLAPRHLMAELQVLATKVKAVSERKITDTQLKRKRQDSASRPEDNNGTPSQRGRNHGAYSLRRGTYDSPLASSTHSFDETPRPLPMTPEEPLEVDKLPIPLHWGPRTSSEGEPPLQGLRIIVIHIKDTLTDGPPVSERILTQLQQYEAVAQLGCTFTISKSGTSILL